MADANERASQLLRIPTIEDKSVPREAPGAAAVEHLGPGAKPPLKEGRFSLFIPEHLVEGLALAEEFMRIANDNPGEAGLQKVLDRAEKEAKTRSVALVQYALMVFIT